MDAASTPHPRSSRARSAPTPQRWSGAGRRARLIARGLLALQALGEYGALTGGGSAGGSALQARMRQVVEWATDHRTALIIVGVIVALWIVLPPRRSP